MSNNNTDVLLTIAIPTYNRAQLLIESLDSLVNQVEAGVEILVNDNASTDNTRDVVHRYQAMYPFIRYSRNDQNLGADGNFLVCLQTGRGDFIQLLSDDDVLIPGAIHKILQTIKSHNELSIIRTNCCAFQNQLDLDNLAKPAYPISSNIIFNNKNEFLGYVGFASIFMSPTIYNKKIFNQISNPSRFIGTHLLQTHLLFECLAVNNNAVIIADVCVAARVGMPVGFNQIRVLVTEWRKVLYETCVKCNYSKKIIRKVFDETIRNNMPNTVRESHLSEHVFGSTFKLIFSDTWKFPSAWLFVYPYALLPSWLLRKLSVVKSYLRQVRKPL